VEIYPSLLGLEQMKTDSLAGPPTAIFQKDYKPRRPIVKHDESDSEEERYAFLEEQNQEDRRAYDQVELRKYEI
jgi:hypothetical protein